MAIGDAPPPVWTWRHSDPDADDPFEPDDASSTELLCRRLAKAQVLDSPYTGPASIFDRAVYDSDTDSDSSESSWCSLNACEGRQVEVFDGKRIYSFLEKVGEDSGAHYIARTDPAVPGNDSVDSIAMACDENELYPLLVMVKVMAIQAAHNNADPSSTPFIRELGCLRRIASKQPPSPFLPKNIHFFYDSKNYYLSSNFVRIDLSTLLKQEVLRITDIVFFAAEILVALEHLHSMGITYGSIEFEDVLIDADGHVLLSNFSSAFRTVHSQLPISRLEAALDLCPYALFVEELLHMMRKALLRTECPQTSQHVEIRSSPPGFEADVAFDEDSWNLMNWLFHYDPFNPPSINDIKSRAFFASIDWKKCARRELSPPYQPELPSICFLESNEFDLVVGEPVENPEDIGELTRLLEVQ